MRKRSTSEMSADGEKNSSSSSSRPPSAKSTAPPSAQPTARPSSNRESTPATSPSAGPLVTTAVESKVEQLIPLVDLNEHENSTAIPTVTGPPTTSPNGELKSPPATSNQPPTPTAITPLQMPVESPPASAQLVRLQHPADFDQPNDQPKQPPTSKITLPQSQLEIELQREIEGPKRLRSFELTPAPLLPRRKSRMPQGERLSLVQFNNPEPAPLEDSAVETPNPLEQLNRIAACSLPPIEPEKQLRCIMDCILPPRKREMDGRSWLERASTVPSTRLDLLGLQQKFENELKVSRAKPFGICPIRRRIYDEMFDELIRQVTINCAERGLLLLRVRDEVHLTVLSYQSLLESAIGYGIRKAILVEQEQNHASRERDLERAKNAELTKRVTELEKQVKQERVIKEEEMKLLEERMKDENERLAESNRTLKMHLQSVLQMDQQLQVAQTTSTEGPANNQKD